MSGDLTIGVLGLGRVGLPVALGFAELGWNVVGADADPATSARLAAGEPLHHEPGVPDLLVRHLDSGRFRVAPGADAVREAGAVFVCVPTPRRDDGSSDLRQVEDASRVIADHMDGYTLVVEKSTNPVGSAACIRDAIAARANGAREWDVAVNPEFLREGRALEYFFDPDRIVLGVESDRARDLLLRIYAPLLERNGRGRGRVLVTDPATAETIKHAANAFLATRLSFVNLLADFCEAAGVDVGMVARGLGADARIGPEFLDAGAGFGGCFPKDLASFTHTLAGHGVDPALLEAVARVNDERPERLIRALADELGGLAGRTVAVWGLAFKPGVDDVRDAPSLRAVARLVERGARVRLHDPMAMDEFRARPEVAADAVAFAASAVDAARGADAVLLLTEWPEYREIDAALLRAAMATPLVVDGRNFLDREALARAGFTCRGVGR